MIKAGERNVSLLGLSGSSKYLITAALSKILNVQILYICSTRKKAGDAARSISYFLNEPLESLYKNEIEIGKALYSSTTKHERHRASWLHAALQNKPIVAEIASLYEKIIPARLFKNSLINIRKGDTVFREDLVLKLKESGYTSADFVEKKGEFSLRGSIVDIFSPGQQYPSRLEFIGDQVGSIRLFSSENQKSLNKIENLTILPASEIILNTDTIPEALNYINNKALELEIPARDKAYLLDEVEKGTRLSNIEWLLPAFYPNPGSVFDYLGQDCVIINDGVADISAEGASFIREFPSTEKLLKKHLHISPSTSELIFNDEYVAGELSGFPNVLIRDFELSGGKSKNVNFHTEPVCINAQIQGESPLDALAQEIRRSQENNFIAHLVFGTLSEMDKITHHLSDRAVSGFTADTGKISEGFRFPGAKLSVITEQDFLGEKKKTSFHKSHKDVPSAFITSFSELKPGDHIVHVEFGIGIFRGLKRLRIGNSEGDYLQCEYAGGDKIYVPTDRLKLVQRYIGDSKSPRVDKLGRQSWQSRIRKVRKAVESVARELLELYARRKAEKGFSYSPADKMYQEFELSFPYNETPDQESAIEDVVDDMEIPRPMDRLICGDVGFGKTEVALRAAFKAVIDQKQVAFLVPTTLLAHQHHNTSIERLKDYPVTIEVVSRFITAKREKDIIKRLNEGKVDILIGTHKLLGKKIQFNDLGLIIVDEEHRFGVSQKEILKKIKNGVDSLSLSATPIPRTLQLSLAKIRDISLINTPPQGRQSIETNVYKSSPNIIHEAISKELARGGCVFFIHNRIESIYKVAEGIRKLFPDARIEVTHGKLSGKVLEDSIAKFIKGEIDILVTTAIVESGLDIPRANTIIIDNAHTFGLADLYQLRGRVGRSDSKAYAYLLIPDTAALTYDAQRRLKAMSEFKELGSGFKLALSDLEIRGAGHLFGNEQSGHITDVGLELYLEMLEGAVKRLGGEEPIQEADPDISVNIPAFIPDEYIRDDSERLLFYKRLSSLNKVKELNSIKDELKDRFGKLPDSVSTLLKTIELKIMMKKLGIKKAEIRSKRTVILFGKSSEYYDRFKPNGRMELFLEDGNPLNETKKILRNLTRGKV